MKRMKEGITRQASMGGGKGTGGTGDANSSVHHEKIATLKKELDALQDSQVQGKSAVLLKLVESEKKNRALTDESIQRYGHKLQTGIMKFISDLKAGHNETSTKLDNVEKISNRLRDIHAEQAFAAGGKLTKKVMEKWVLSLCRKAFFTWRDMDPSGYRPVGVKLQGHLLKIWLRFTTCYGFNKWKSKIKEMNRRSLLKGHLRNILIRWKRFSYREVK
jgi:hypothetical protein